MPAPSMLYKLDWGNGPNDTCPTLRVSLMRPSTELPHSEHSALPRRGAPAPVVVRAADCMRSGGAGVPCLPAWASAPAPYAKAEPLQSSASSSEK